MKVCVLMGGNSAEREVSLKSGEAVSQALESRGHQVIRFDPKVDKLVSLTKLSPDAVFIALHGRGGEDGTIQGYLEQVDVPYTGSGVMASSVAMNKQVTKLIWQALGMPVADGQCVTSLDELKAPEAFPVFVKPVKEGSSIGMSRVDTQEALAPAVTKAFEFDRQVLVEAFIDGDEYTCAILGDEALPVIGLKTDALFYDYEAKYQSHSTQYCLPSGLSEQEEAEAKALCLEAFKSIGCFGWGRVDFMRDKEGQFWLLEVNTSPGMTSHSLVPMAAKAVGISFPELAERVIELSLNR